jgi:hypothetical protein
MSEEIRTLNGKRLFVSRLLGLPTETPRAVTGRCVHILAGSITQSLFS